MKVKFILFILILILSSCEKNETQEFDFEYTELNDIKLKFSKSSYFILTADEISGRAKELELSRSKEKGEIISYSSRNNLSFYVYGNKRIVNKSDYLSEIYYTEEGSSIIILPRLIVFLKNSHQIDNIITDYKDLLTSEEQINNQKYIFKCNVSKSEEMIQIVNTTSNKNGVDWCEPDMLMDLKTFDQY